MCSRAGYLSTVAVPCIGCNSLIIAIQKVSRPDSVEEEEEDIVEDSVGIVVVFGERGVHAYGVCILDSSKRRCVEVGALSRGDSVGNQLVLRGSIHVYGVCIINSSKRR